MENILNKPEKIDESIIHGFPFVKQDVLKFEEDQKERFRKLVIAMQLGNLYKQHVKIKFTNNENALFETIATVWAVTEKFVILKGNTFIPIHSIYEVEFM